METDPMIRWRDIEQAQDAQNGASRIFWVDEVPLSTHYRTLGVHHIASSSTIKQAYRELAMLHHPDLHHGPSRLSAEARMRQINAAYSVLRSPTHRKAYDASLDSR